MPDIKVVQPGEKIGLKLSAAQRLLIVKEVKKLDSKFSRALQDTPAKQPLSLTLEDWDELSDSISTAADECQQEQLEEKLTDITLKIDTILLSHCDDAEDELNPFGHRHTNARHGVQLTEWANEWLAQAKACGLAEDPVFEIPVADIHAKLPYLNIPEVTQAVAGILRDRSSFSAIEIASLVRALVQKFETLNRIEQIGILMIVEDIMRGLEDMAAKSEGRTKKAGKKAAKKGIKKVAKKSAKKKVAKAVASKAAASDSAQPIYQIKISLKHVQPPVWRRILIKNCSLDTLHGYIQAVMPWSNSHLHRFIVGRETYSATDMLDDGWGDESDDIDSADTMLSDVVPAAGKKFRFQYIYDFGDDWDHEVVVEKILAAHTTMKYPLCSEGAGACPPEDIGGPWGYADMLEAVANPKHPRYRDFAEMLEEMGPFDPLAFSAEAATKAMRRAK
jgi:hypothetical protein